MKTTTRHLVSFTRFNAVNRTSYATGDGITAPASLVVAAVTTAEEAEAIRDDLERRAAKCPANWRPVFDISTGTTADLVGRQDRERYQYPRDWRRGLKVVEANMANLAPELAPR